MNKCKFYQKDLGQITCVVAPCPSGCVTDTEKIQSFLGLGLIALAAIIVVTPIFLIPKT